MLHKIVKLQQKNMIKGTQSIDYKHVHTVSM